MARTRTREGILKDTFKSAPITRKGKITKTNKKGESKEINVDIPVVGKIETEIRGNRYNAYMTTHCILLDDIDLDHGYGSPDDTEESIKEYGESCKRIVENVLHDNYYAIRLYKDVIKDWIVKCKEEKNKSAYRIEFEKDKVIGVNPEYLLNILNWCDTDTIYINPDHYKISPILALYDDDTEWYQKAMAITLPVRIKTKY